MRPDQSSLLPLVPSTTSIDKENEGMEKLQAKKRELEATVAQYEQSNRELSLLLEARSRDLRQMERSITYKLGRFISAPFRIVYDNLWGNTNIDRFPLWLIGHLAITSALHPIKSLRHLSIENLKKLLRGLREEPFYEVAGNFEKLIGIRVDQTHLQILNHQSTSDINTANRFQILFVSPNLPDFDTSGGGRRATEILALLAESYDVFVFTKGERPKRHIDKLQSHGLRVIESHDESALKVELPYADVIIYAWYYTFYSCEKLRTLYPLARSIADTVDVHWVRELRSMGLREDLTLQQINSNKSLELQVYENVDIIWAVTEPDRQAILEELPNKDVRIIANVNHFSSIERKESNSLAILFFGGYQHYPNIFALQDLATKIFPLIKQECPDAKLIVAGSKAPDEIVALGDLPGIDYRGFVKEEDVAELYHESALTIVPLVSGAGIKIKICQAISYGLPVITNSIGNEGINLINEVEGLITEDHSQMARYAIDILNGTLPTKEMASAAQKKLKIVVGADVVKNELISSISPMISICIVTWNKLELLRTCINSILANTTYPRYRIILHSNGCDDGTKEYLEELSKLHENIIPILAKTNSVFVRPNNEMMQLYPGDDVVLLNNDTTVTKGWLVALYRAAYSDQKHGIAGSKILYPDGRLQEFGSKLFANGTGVNIGKNQDPNLPQFQGVKKAPYVSACSMLIKRTTIDRIGVFDDKFHPCYCEDSDFCYSGWKEGIETVVTSGSIVYHHEGATSGNDTSVGFKKFQEVNMKKFLEKHGDAVFKINERTTDTQEIRSSERISIWQSDFEESTRNLLSDTFGKTLLHRTQSKMSDSHVLQCRDIGSFAEFLSYEEEMHEIYERRLEIERKLIEGRTKSFHFSGYNHMLSQWVEYRIDMPQTSIVTGTPNWRETVLCPLTHTNSRLRLTAHVIELLLKDLREVDPQIYITEQSTPFYRALAAQYPSISGSDYRSPSTTPGEIRNGMRHEDLTRLSFQDKHFDLIISLEVLEHIPDYRKALSEIYRCLKRKGKILFSVPFVVHNALTITRAKQREDGTIDHLMEPEYHGDPLSTEGILCYYHFGWDLFDVMKDLGFRDTKMIFCWSLVHGILGKDQFVISAEK